jgi:hypothetical protein
MNHTDSLKIIATFRQRAKEEITATYNPTEVSFDNSVQLAEISIPGLDSPLIQFVRGQCEKLTLDLFFDTTDKGMDESAVSVTTETDKVYGLTKIEPGGHAPPICEIKWNSKFPGAHIPAQFGNQRRNSFKCVIESVKQKFTLFSTKGVPVRATLSTTFREYKTLDDQLRQLNLTSPDRTHSHVVRRGDSLASIADKYYLDSGKWRYIAEKNGIHDPRRLAVGTSLEIPPID